jgi:hypothetical protein
MLKTLAGFNCKGFAFHELFPDFVLNIQGPVAMANYDSGRRILSTYHLGIRSPTLFGRL